MEAPLFERLGKEPGITQFVSDLVDAHLANPVLVHHFKNSDTNRLKRIATEFVITAVGGPRCYNGKGMKAVHKGMKISAEEFIQVLDDALIALDKNKVAQREREQVLWLLYSLKADILSAQSTN
ncbi:group I truncated hemoglobin [Paraferrimonas haliotis]|uniref:Group 1 truncated hemoglobin n=1 Tax=Paraferrimonas haliotis TaxID=2013866 RepID=A0AA37TJB5_9GAMM|nr:group 1 truncated hemoglobin [Paraferrimonas haliotis]GLS82582.1 hypothetical protein GCM10007894_05590 [Paraferrimonas haliotis]